MHGSIVWRRASLLALTVVAASVLPAVATGQERSVRPGVNDSFVDPDVTQFVERFEREGREVYDHRKELVAACGLKPGMSVADVGAGTGLHTMLFSQQVGDDGKVYAVDISPKFIDHIAAKCRENHVNNVVGVVCSADDVNLPPNSIDVAFICDVYHHFEYPYKTMASIRRALRPGGHVIVVDFERIDGVSSEWIMGHVRAGRETVMQEILDSGFELVDAPKLLTESYVLKFAVARSASSGGAE